MGTDFLKRNEGWDEAIVDPDMPIVDAHHHLFDRPSLRYWLDDYLRDARRGHRVRATVYIETLAMAHDDGPAALRPLGEIEFALGVGEAAASTEAGDCRVAAGIVGFADMTGGDRVADYLDRALEIAPERLKGVRQIALWHPDPQALRFLTNKPAADVLAAPGFGDAMRHLASRSLSFDATVLHPQLPALAAVAARHEGTVIVLDHMGLAMAMDATADERREVFSTWRSHLHALARHPNVVCKIGGLGTNYWGFGFGLRRDPIGSEELCEAWTPYIETAIEAFGVERCMMESDFPNDGRSCGFVPLWNALKLAVRDLSRAEKTALFYGTARRVYRLDLPEVG